MKKVYIILSITLFVGAGLVGVYGSEMLRPAATVQNKTDDGKNSEVQTSAADLGYDLPGEYTLLQYPVHIFQSFNNCGPATLTMMLNYYGVNVSQSELGEKMRPFQNPRGDNDDKTIFSSEFVDWSKVYGLEAVSRVGGDIDMLKKLTTNGFPVVVKTWLHSYDDIGHFRVVRGFDDNSKVIIQDDSYEGKDKRIAYTDFLSLWQPFNYNFIVVYPKNKEILVNAILGDYEDERQSWNKALEKAKKDFQTDEKNVYPWFNMSTSYFHLGDFPESIAAFEKVENKLPRRMLWYQIEPILSYKEVGNYTKALSIIDKVLNDQNRAYSELYQIRGEIYLLQDMNDLARKEFETAIYYNKYYQKPRDSLTTL